MIDSIKEGFTLLDAEFRIVDVNAEALRLDGRSAADLIGKTHWEAYPGSEDSELGRLYKRAMRDSTPVTLEHHYLWGDGHSAWLDMRAYPVDGGGLALFFRDVTERRLGEQRLRESEARFHAAIDAVQGILWTNDAEGRMSGEQPGWARLTGQPFDDYQGFGWASAVHPDDAQPTLDAWDASVEARTPFVFAHRVRHHSGDWRRFAIHAVPVTDETGAIREWVGVHTDITEAEETSARLAGNAQTFASLVRNNPFGIYVVDGAFRLLEVSEGASKVFASIDPLIDRDFAEILRLIWAEPFASEAIGRFRHTLATGEAYVSLNTIELRANVAATEAYDWRIERIALPDGSNGVVCYFYDLSARMALEGELRQALTDKDLLAREIDHRIMNSLTIVGSLLTLQSSQEASVATKTALATAATRVTAIARVHQRLYQGHTVGKIEFGEYLQRLCKDIADTLGRDGMQFEVDAALVEIPVDMAVPLGIIANELITNACKYCGSDADARIGVMLAADAATLRLVVFDNGLGMPTDFSPERGKTLGLTAVKALVRQVGGTIEFPLPGAEARFVVTVPLPQ